MTRIVNNIQLAHIFHDMAKCYRFLGSKDRFRAVAYDNAAKMLSNMEEDVAGYASNIKSLEELNTIGESIAEKIIEYLHTGKIESFEALKKGVPFELLDLLDITGFGPATLNLLYKKYGITNKEELIDALDNHQIQDIKGFGEKKIQSMQRMLKLYKGSKRIPLADAERMGNVLIAELLKIKGVQSAVVAGSIRRGSETIGDIDIVVIAKQQDRKRIVKQFILSGYIEKVLMKGNAKVSVILKYKHLQADIRIFNDYEYGAAMLYSTGSKQHVIRLRMIAKERGYKMNEYGMFDASTNQWLGGATEEEMYQLLGLRYIPPEQRLNNGEIENAKLEPEIKEVLDNEKEELTMSH